MRLWLLVLVVLAAGTYAKKTCKPTAKTTPVFTGSTDAAKTEATQPTDATQPTGQTTETGKTDAPGDSSSTVTNSDSTSQDSTIGLTTESVQSSTTGDLGEAVEDVDGAAAGASSTTSSDDATTTDDECEWPTEETSEPGSETTPVSEATPGSTKAPATRGGVTVSYSNFKMDCQKEPGSCVYRYDVPQQTQDQMEKLKEDKAVLDKDAATAVPNLQAEVDEAETKFANTSLADITKQVNDLQKQLDDANAKVKEYTVTLNYMKNETLQTTYAINQMNGYLASIAADKNNCYYYCTQPLTTTPVPSTTTTTKPPPDACTTATNCANKGFCTDPKTPVCRCYGNLDGAIKGEIQGCSTSVCPSKAQAIVFPDPPTDSSIPVHFYSPGYNGTVGNYTKLAGCSWFLTTGTDTKNRWQVDKDKPFTFTTADSTARMNITYVPFFLAPASTTTSYLVTKLTPADLNNILTMADAGTDVTFALSSTQNGGYFGFDFSYLPYSSSSRSEVLPVGA